LTGFADQQRLQAHRQLCGAVDPVTVKMPSGSKAWVSFSQYATCLLHPLVIYADVESVLDPYAEE